MRSCIDDPDPCMFIENMPSYWQMGTPAETGHRVPIGKANIVRPGSDVTVVTYSRMVNEAASAITAIGDAASVELIDLRTIAPWDKATVLESAARTGRVLIVHEAVTPFGVGAEIAATLHHELFSQLKKPVERLGGAFCPVPFSKPLEDAFAPNAERIAAAITALMRD
jgi:pyruvate dehydrogenase E1 component beta subunit